ncbi:hypothetical protein B7494_g7318 [Chlorociboria aeruginascens]|nr:hypothetical protein B7494_g7318 [Chlorociboria aeruginascens]
MSSQKKGAACIHCRQMKLRCDAHFCFPAPCSRCAKRKLHCSIDPSFRRTAKRQRIDAIERELHELKASIETSPAETHDQNYHCPSYVTEPPLPRVPNPILPPNSQEHLLLFETQKIDEVEVEPSVISELFDMLSSRLGVPSTVVVDNSILSALTTRPSWLPAVLEQHLKIEHQSFQFCHTLGHNQLTTTGLLPDPASVIRMFDTYLHALEVQSGSEWTMSSEMAFLKAKLQLYSFVGTDNTSESTSASASGLALGMSDILAQACLSAVKIIQIACNSAAETLLWTSNDRASILYAVFFLIKLSTSPQHHFLDQITTRNSISQVWNLYHGSSHTKEDHASRVCAVIEFLSKKNETEGKKGSSVNVESRMAANLLIDAVWRARERFSKGVRDSRPLDYTAAEGDMSYLFEMDFQMNSSYPEGIFDEEALWPDENTMDQISSTAELDDIASIGRLSEVAPICEVATLDYWALLTPDS